jgi:uncharacterized Fe-S radical SAM superfamily protein PflX
MFRPAYLSLGSAELHRRADRAIASLAECRACPRDCGVNRLEDKWAACKTGRYELGLRRLDVRRPHPELARRINGY